LYFVELHRAFRKEGAVQSSELEFEDADGQRTQSTGRGPRKIFSDADGQRKQTSRRGQLKILADADGQGRICGCGQHMRTGVNYTRKREQSTLWGMGRLDLRMRTRTVKIISGRGQTERVE